MNRSTFRRAVALLMAVIMSFCLCACGGKSEAEVPVVTETPAPTPAPTPTPEPTPEPIIGELLSDEDGDGIINYKFNYKGSTVYALIVLDPSRVYIGTALPEPSEWGGYGLTLDVMAEQYGAIAGINAGGFVDEYGAGNGWPPSGITYSRGVNFSSVELGPIAGLDYNNDMWAGYYSYAECEAIGIRDAVCFGPALIVDGVKADPATFEKGIGARTAIGQREDGAVVMMVVDGRQGYSVGLTFADCADIMVDKFGCVNASNMDGGNSSCMYFYGQAVNRSANQAGGTRNLPDAWLVNPLPDGYVRPEDVPEYIVLPENPLGEIKEYEYECDPETSDRMLQFAYSFAEAYYGYFGTSNADYYYPTLMQYVAQGSELHQRMDLALMDRTWVNTYRTDVNYLELIGAYSNGDGSFDIVISSDLYEQATYWGYEAPATRLRITVVEAPESLFGYLAINTF